ncbi:DUF5820 family protein [Halobaculum limi]|uniref:DUF5820 family protein n=1 Tax=Halobaculum limi TaxID=3031916 RepID=UPI003D8102B5
MTDTGDDDADPTVEDSEGTSIAESTLADGWRVWTEETDGRAIVVYRPDVFDGGQFPPPCLPTLYLTNGSRRARPGAGQRQTDDWHVTLFLEPEVEVTARTFDDRAAAVKEVHRVAAAFDAGDIDYRDAYQVPREEYLDELDRLIRAE